MASKRSPNQSVVEWLAASSTIYDLLTRGVPVVIATGLGTWMMSYLEILRAQGWPAWLFAGAVLAFCVLGAAAFVSSLRFRWQATSALRQGVTWNSANFSPHSIVDGGTHTIPEIFGNSAVRSNVMFRNCHIVGPGVVSLFQTRMDKCEISGVPIPVVVHQNPDLAQIANCFHTLHKCTFLNCTFYNIMLIDNPGQTQATHWFAAIRPAQPELPLQLPKDTATETPQ